MDGLELLDRGVANLALLLVCDTNNTILDHLVLGLANSWRNIASLKRQTR